MSRRGAIDRESAFAPAAVIRRPERQRRFAAPRNNMREIGTRSRRNGIFLAVVALFTFLLVLPVAALVFPALSGRVVDEANILDQATHSALTQKLADLE